MINSFKKKSWKWSAIGIILVVIIGTLNLVNPKSANKTSKDTIKLNANKPVVQAQQTEVNTSANESTISEDSNSDSVINKDYLSELKFVLPKNWSINKSQKKEYFIINEKGESIGSIDTYDYTEDFDLAKQQPNHSGITKDEYIDIPLGKCRLITLDSDNGTAASGLTGTHDAYFAGIAVNNKVIYILNFTRNDKKPETKTQFMEILKGLSVN